MICEKLVVDLPVLPHLRLHTKTLLEENILSLDGTDCSPNGLLVTKGGQISRLTIARLNCVPNDHVDSATSVSQIGQR